MGRKLGLEVAQQCQAVLALLRREEPAAVIARRYGISLNTLYRLRDRFLEAGKAGLSERGGSGKSASARLAKLESDLAEHDRVIGELTIANRILKKTSEGSM
jgi:transposase-like protein